MKNTMKRMALVGATILSLAAGTKAQTLDQRVVYDNQNDIRSQTIYTDKAVTAIAEAHSGNYEAGANVKVDSTKLSTAFRDKEDLQSTRLNLQVGNLESIKLGAEYHTAETKTERKELVNGYLAKKLGNTALEVGYNSDTHLQVLSRTALNENNSMGLAGVVSEDEYSRYGIAGSHTGSIGLFGYAIKGKNADGSSHEDFRLYGGLGNKTTKASIGTWSLDNYGFLDEDLLEDVTFGFMTGPFNNYGAQVRGNPLGFDARFKNDVASLELAVNKGMITLLEKTSYNFKTDKDSYQIEAQANLGNGFYAKAQSKFEDDVKPNNAFLVGYKVTFGGK